MFDNGLFIGLVFTGIGLYAVILGLREMVRAAESSEWPEVVGQVEATGVLSELSKGTTTYAPEVRYRYRVGDAEYVGNRIAFGGTFSSSFWWWAKSVVERYRREKTVKVRVCPTDPDLSVLEPGIRWLTWFFPLVGAIFTAIGISNLVNYFA